MHPKLEEPSDSPASEHSPSLSPSLSQPPVNLFRRGSATSAQFDIVRDKDFTIDSEKGLALPASNIIIANLEQETRAFPHITTVRRNLAGLAINDTY